MGMPDKLLSRFCPDDIINSVYDVDYKKLFDLGFRAVAYDVDNTVVLHNQPATEECIQLFHRIHEAGLKICVISNNRERRVKSFAQASGADLYFYDAEKPRPAVYLQAVESLHVKAEELVFFGDQIFTDIWGGKNADLKSVLVKPMGREILLQIKVKRWLEKLVLRKCRKEHMLPEGGFVPLLDRE